MATTATSPTNNLTPASQADVAEAVRAAYSSAEGLCPVGGGTALTFGGTLPTTPRQLVLTGLNRIVDYTPRDMTILVEAGVRMADLAATLASEGQQLPIDIPRASEATIGGVVATNWCGPRRYGHGTIRDYVIGIHAVDGRGVAFKGGGRVVKNVAGYDFCKLLTGSLGTLGIITQLALKVKPQPECVTTVVAECADLNVAETALQRLALLEAPPAAIDLLIGDAWNDATGGPPAARPQPHAATIRTPQSAIRNYLAVRIEGTEVETRWLADLTQAECAAAGASSSFVLSSNDATKLWSRQVEFSDRGVGDGNDASPMVLQIIVPPSSVVEMISKVLVADPACTIQAHAASGVILARFKDFSHSDLTMSLAGKLRPAAVRLGGSAIVVRSSLDGITPHLAWGGRNDAVVLLERIKQKFDPKNILNPGRYIL